MARKEGDISQNGVKPDIIKFILENNGQVEEPQIREHLKKKNKKVNQGNVNRHLHELRDEFNCIELKTIKKGRRTYNLWDITKLESLKNIQIYFKNIELNKYEKSLMIILNETGHFITSLTGLQFYIRLFLSASFFDMCIKTNIEKLFSRAWKIYLCDKGFGEDLHIKYLLNEFYTLYIKDNPNFEISSETFQVTMRELAQRKAENSEEIFSKMWEEKFSGLYKEITREKFMKIKEELVQRIAGLMEVNPETELFYEKFGEKYPGLSREHMKEILIDKVYHIILEKEVLDHSKDYENSIESFRKTIGQDREMHTKMERILELITLQQSDFKMSRFDLLLESFLYFDILNGIGSPDELEFVKKLKENEAIRDALFTESKDQKDREEVVLKWFLSDLEQSSKIIFYYKKPSIFSKNYNTSDEVYQGLIDFFGFRSLLK